MAAAALQAARVSSGSHASCSCSSGSGAGAPACWTAGRPALRLPERPQLAAQRLCSSRRQQGSGGMGASMRGGRAAARAAAEEAAAGALVPDRQGYRSFLMEGAEFLVAESADGQLDLRDVYVTTDVSSNGFAVALPTTGGDDDGDDEAPPSVKPGAAYKRPAGAEGVSVAPRAYQAVPWYSWWGGDYIQEKPGKTWVRGGAGPGACCWNAA